MATEAKRYIHVADTTTALTTANDLMKKGELWFDITLKKFKIAPTDGVYTTQQFYRHDWNDLDNVPATFPPSAHTHPQSAITGLVDDLAGKASFSHTHDAGATITGVFDPNRLPIATGSTRGAVKGGPDVSIAPDGTLSITGGGSGGGWSPGFIFDVRNPAFAGGIAAGSSNARQNTLAIQAAVDAAAVAAGGNGNGTVFIPAVERQVGTYIYTEGPVWMNCDNTLITGLSDKSTAIYSMGPAFCMAKHPRYWDIERKILTDKVTGGKLLARQYENELKHSQLTAANPTLESGQVVYIRHESNGTLTGEYKTGPGAYNSLPMSTGATTFPRPELSYFDRYKINLRRFRTVGGDFPPTNGNPEFGPCATIGVEEAFALRFWSGAVKGDFWYHPIAIGDKNHTNQSATRWKHHATATFEAVIQHITPVWWGGIFGSGSETKPDPFILFAAGDDSAGPGDSPTTGRYYFDLALTNAGGIRKTWLRFKFPQNPTVGIHRIAIQFNPAAATVADRLVAFVDGVRKAVEIQDLSTFYPGTDGPKTQIETTDRIARWETSQLSIGAESNSAGGFAVGEQHPYLHHSDGILIAASAHAKLLYTTPAVGQPQARIGGGALDDSTVWGPTGSSGADVLGFVHNSYSVSPRGIPTLEMTLGSNRNMGQGGTGCIGVFGPRAGAHGLAQAPSGNTIANMSFSRFENWPNSAALMLYSFINQTKIVNCHIAQYGYFMAIGSMTTVASYYLYVEDCIFGRGNHFSHATVYGKDWTFTFVNNAYVRSVGTKLKLDGMTTAAIQSMDEAVFVILAGGSIGSSTYLKRIQCNFEGLHFQPQDHIIMVERAFATAGDGLWIEDSVFGEFASPFLYLADYIGTQADNRTANVEIKNVGFSTPSEVVIVQGNRWKTGKAMIEVGLSAYTSVDMVKYVNAKNGANYNAVTTVLRDGYGIPQCGGFIRNSHVVEIMRPAQGGPTGWICENADETTRKKEGTDDTPIWKAIGRAPSRNTSALSANFFPGLHANCVLPYNGTKTFEFTGVTKAFSRRLLEKTLNATSAAAPTHFRGRWGYYNTYIEERSYPEGFFDTGAVLLSSIFGTPAASGSKATTATVTANGLNVPNWSVFPTKPACGMFELGDSSVGPVGQGAFAFLTSPWTPADWAVTTAINPVIAIGGISFKRTNRGSGMCDWLTNRQIDWMTGTAWTPPATWHFGLSTTEPNQALGTGITEPSGGSYGRVAVTANASNFGELEESSFFANRNPIQWTQPTGDWGEPLYVFASDASTGGNILAVAPINFPIRITAASRPPVFFPGAMVFQI